MNTLKLGMATMLALSCSASFATNGYFSHGYGTKSKGRGGVSLAISDDTMAGATNPALFADLNNRIDAGFDAFVPRRGAERTNGPLGQFNFNERSDRNLFIIPDFGMSKKLSQKLTVGVTVYGNGGMNTQYPAFPNGMNLFGGTGQLGVDLMQLLVAPPIASKVSDNHSVGVSPLLVYQVFKAYGLDGMGLPNQGTDSSTGLGVRLGYMGQFGDAVTVGASYSPKINMSRFKDYANLFAENGDFDIPENYALGVAVKVTPAVQVALDYTRINYSGVASIGNASSDPAAPGFGWQDVKTVKLGVQWQMNNQWTLRAGYNHGTNPIQPADAFLNILAPGVIKSHITVGGTYAMSTNEELTFAAWHGKKNTVTGPSMAGPVSISMSQNGVGLQYSRKF